MNARSADITLVATCAGGLEDTLEGEVSSRGWTVKGRAHGAVRFTGPPTAIAESNITLRTASRVLMPVARGPVRSYDDLYGLAKRADWKTLAPPSYSIGVSTVSTDRAMSDTRFATLRVKDAVVDAQKRSTGRRSDVEGRKAAVGIVVHVADGHAEISLDTTGKPLHIRGYRTESGDAPLRETVAAGMVLMSGWQPGQRLLDPFCGSGTIVIEAAMMAAGIYPGIARESFAFLRWPDADRSGFKRIRARLRAERTQKTTHRPGETPFISGSDLDARVLDVATRNAERGGVADWISFRKEDFFSGTGFAGERDGEPGDSGPGDIIVTNPPYGERMSLQDAAGFYRKVGDHMKQHFKGTTAWILSANMAAMKQIGLRTSAKLPLYNGGLESRLYRIDLY